MGESVNIKEYLDMFRRRKWIIILVMLVCLGFGGYRTYTNYVSYLPTYKATVKIKINSMKEYNEAVEKSKSKKSSKKDSEDSSTGMTEKQRVLNNINSSYSASASMTNQNIASSYVSLVSSENVRKNVAALSKVQSSQILSISAIQDEQTPEFINMTVIAKTADGAHNAAAALPEAYNEELKRVINLDCVESPYPAGPGVLQGRTKDLTLLKSFAAGLVIAIFLVLLVEVLDTKIKTPEDVEKYWGLPLIGTIPFDDGKQQKGRK